jgi:O-antigen/teichoic acid export membrane protein
MSDLTGTLIGAFIGAIIAIAIIYIWIRLEKKYFSKKVKKFDDLWEEVQKELDRPLPIEVTLGE